MIPISFATTLTGRAALIVAASLAGVASAPHLEVLAVAGALGFSLIGLLAVRTLGQPGAERFIGPAELPSMERAA